MKTEILGSKEICHVIQVLSNALVTAANNGLSGRADPKIEDNLNIVGDWVGSEVLLSTASFASAKRAAQLIHNQLAF